jgi:1-acyl-sn-glycerol-3-phosphate acyltransferase
MDAPTPGPRFYNGVRTVVLAICRVLFRVEVLGTEHVPTEGVYIAAPSHRSMLDIPMTAFITRRRLRYMAKREIFDTWFGHPIFRRMAAIPVDRDVTDRSSLRGIADALDAGEPVVVYPEGTRMHGRELGPLFDGTAYVARKHGASVLPIGIGGTDRLSTARILLLRRPRICVVVGEPIVAPVAEGPVRRAAVSAATEELRYKLQACLDEANTRITTR